MAHGPAHPAAVGGQGLLVDDVPDFVGVVIQGLLAQRQCRRGREQDHQQDGQNAREVNAVLW
jgi:hypothetical protein